HWKASRTQFRRSNDNVEPGALARVFVENSAEAASEKVRSNSTKTPGRGRPAPRWIEVPMTNERITLSRACEVIGIPSGIHEVLQAGTQVRIMQSLGGSYTVWTDHGECTASILVMRTRSASRLISPKREHSLKSKLEPST